MFESPRKNAGMLITSEIILLLSLVCMLLYNYTFHSKKHLSYLYTKGKGLTLMVKLSV